jgi:hypothetical protein
MKIVLLGLIAFTNLSAMAGPSYYCSNIGYLIDLETGNSIRKVSSSGDECKRLLASSKSGFYCDDGGFLRGLEDGMRIRRILSDEGGCPRLLESSKHGFYCGPNGWLRDLRSGYNIRSISTNRHFPNPEGDCATILRASNKH